MISRHANTPIYRQLAATLRERVQNGHYSGFLPTETGLAYEFITSRDTVRKALATLRNEGLIETRRGSPARVLDWSRPTTIAITIGDTVTARMPAPDERVDFDIPYGVPVLVVAAEVHPAHQCSLVVAPDRRSPHSSQP